MNGMQVGGEFFIRDADYVPQWIVRVQDDKDIQIVRCNASGVEQETVALLKWSNGVVTMPGGTVVVPLTNSTGVTPDNTVGDLTAVVAAAGEATAADLTTTQTAFGEVKDSLADLTGKVNEILTALGIPAA